MTQALSPVDRAKFAAAKRDIDALQLQLKDALDRDLETTRDQQKSFLAKCDQGQLQLERIVEDANEFEAQVLDIARTRANRRLVDCTGR